jgi:hypothetical protein
MSAINNVKMAEKIEAKINNQCENERKRENGESIGGVSESSMAEMKAKSIGIGVSVIENECGIGESNIISGNNQSVNESVNGGNVMTALISMAKAHQRKYGESQAAK